MAAAQDDVVVFASTSPDKEQVAHELTHIVQQRRGQSGGSPGGNPDAFSDPQEKAEQEAGQLATAAASGKQADVRQTAGPQIHRDFLGIGNALGDLFDVRENEAQLDAQEDLADFREQTFCGSSRPQAVKRYRHV